MINQEINYNNCYDADRKMLNLTQRDLSKIPDDFIETYGSSTRKLDVSHNRLTDLNWIYKFPELEELILDNNRLCETHLSRLLNPLENIKILMFNKNEFSDLHNTIAELKRLFPNLEHLSLHGNAICPDGLGLRPFSAYITYDYSYYRSYILTTFPGLKFLDHASTEEIDYLNDLANKTKWFTNYRPQVLWEKLCGYLRRLPVSRLKSQIQLQSFRTKSERKKFVSNEEF